MDVGIENRIRFLNDMGKFLEWLKAQGESSSEEEDEDDEKNGKGEAKKSDSSSSSSEESSSDGEPKNAAPKAKKAAASSSSSSSSSDSSEEDAKKKWIAWIFKIFINPHLRIIVLAAFKLALAYIIHKLAQMESHCHLCL